MHIILIQILILKIIRVIILTQTDVKIYFSEYVEGFDNNKALEIYNPTANAIDLSEYSISRYANGGFSPLTTTIRRNNWNHFQLFVVCLDKQDPNGTGYETLYGMDLLHILIQYQERK